MNNRQNISRIIKRVTYCFFIISIFCFLSGCENTFAGEKTDYLESEEIAGIGAGSAALGGLGLWVKNTGTRNHPARWTTPSQFEKKLQAFLGGAYHPDKTNFLDNKYGNVITSFAAGTILTAANLGWPQGDKEKDVFQDLFLFTSGIFATKGVTDLFKGSIPRLRPNAALFPDSLGTRYKENSSYLRQSFFSGHSSNAFFSATYLNLRLRTIMRREMSFGNYRDWRWASPVVLFGWATFVGWSRIHAYQHYLSDVIFGALAGYLIGELFFSFNEDLPVKNDSSDTINPLFQFTFRF